MRIGTWNIGQGLVRKMAIILDEALRLDLDLVALQEIGTGG